MSDNHDKIDEDQFKRMIDNDTEYARRNKNTFDKLPGTKAVQNFFYSKVIVPKKFPNRFIDKNGNIMLFGFTGTGKTTIARAIGSEYVKHVPNGTFVIISSSFYQSAYIGISQKNITTIFEVLSSLPSCLVFIDKAEDTFRK